MVTNCFLLGGVKEALNERGTDARQRVGTPDLNPQE
jgi:hypothetical protein